MIDDKGRLSCSGAAFKMTGLTESQPVDRLGFKCRIREAHSWGDKWGMSRSIASGDGAGWI